MNRERLEVGRRVQARNHHLERNVLAVCGIDRRVRRTMSAADKRSLGGAGNGTQRNSSLQTWEKSA